MEIIQSIINILILILTLIFYQIKHPLAIGFLLLIQTLIICLITGTIFERFWFSYILFLVFLGGILVLFIYVTALASNEIFIFSMKLIIYIILTLIILLRINLFIDPIEFVIINNYSIFNNILYKSLNENSIFKLYNFPTNFINIFLITYLFFTLIVTVKITNFFFGPLRNLN